jgi:hypothetical protein
MLSMSCAFCASIIADVTPKVAISAFAILSGVAMLVILPSSSATVSIPGTVAACCIALKDCAMASICWSVIPFPIAPATAFAIAPITPIVGAFSAMFIKPRPIFCAVVLIP